MVQNWLLNNGLHLNPSKCEAIVFFTSRSKPLESSAESIASISVPVHLSSFSHLSRIWAPNSIFPYHWGPGRYWKNLVFATSRPVLSDLLWLPVRNRINFKIATITFKILQFQQPSYLATPIPRYVPTRSLRSSSSLSLCFPNRKTGMAKSKFVSSVASNIWNKLSGHLSSFSTLPASKHHLFRVPFPVILHHPRFVMSAHSQMQLRSDIPHRLANLFQLST